MFVFATAEPWGSYHLRPLIEPFASKALHLTPDHLPEEVTIPATTDIGVVSQASAVIITGGSLNEWTEKVGTAAAEQGVPVFYVELAYAIETPYERPPVWLEHAFAGSEFSRQQLVSHLHLNPEQVSVIGYPHLDGLSPLTESDLGSRDTHLLFLGTVENETWNNALLETALACEKLGYSVTYRHHPRVQTNERTLEEDLAKATGIIGAPGTAFIAAAALGIPTWYLQHPSLSMPEGTAHMRHIAHPLPIADFRAPAVAFDAALSQFAPHNPDIIEHYVGPFNGQAAKNLHMKLIMHGTAGL